MTKISDVKQKFIDAIDNVTIVKNEYLAVLVDNCVAVLKNYNSDSDGKVVVDAEDALDIDLVLRGDLRAMVTHELRSKLVYDCGWVFQEYLKDGTMIYEFQRIENSIVNFIKEAVSFEGGDHRFSKQSLFPGAATEEQKNNVTDYWERIVGMLITDGYKILKIDDDMVQVDK